MSNTIKIILISLIIGLYTGFQLRYFSGMNPIMDITIKIIILGLLCIAIILIFKESNRKLKLIQSGILIMSIVIGALGANFINNDRIENPPRTYMSDKNK
ncbi:hypothetical protein [uncultured Aquimarina sp.]|uniref:hypothetical protein n=1 Tax=uncultured Aquimarina sp. TaxID=575652 RepID=UPI002621AEE6|nr:hypothetical protein [uncultured Aquimarina sp.]